MSKKPRSIDLRLIDNPYKTNYDFYINNKEVSKMKLMNWKQNIGKGNLTPQEGEILLRNFRYPPIIDSKGRLMIDTGITKYIIGFQPNGEHSTWVGVTRFKMKGGILWAIPGLLFIFWINNKRKKVFNEAVNLMNQNLYKLKESEN